MAAPGLGAEISLSIAGGGGARLRRRETVTTSLGLPLRSRIRFSPSWRRSRSGRARHQPDDVLMIRTSTGGAALFRVVGAVSGGRFCAIEYLPPTRNRGRVRHRSPAVRRFNPGTSSSIGRRPNPQITRPLDRDHPPCRPRERLSKLARSRGPVGPGARCRGRDPGVTLWHIRVGQIRHGVRIHGLAATPGRIGLNGARS